MNTARAALVLTRNAFHSMAFTKWWLARLSRRGTHPGGRNGEGNAVVGVIGIIPEPTLFTSRYSAAENPTNATSPATRMASQPFPASMMARSHDSAFSLAILASARAVSLKPPPLATTPAMVWSAPRAPRILPLSAVVGTPSASALASVAASASSRASCPASTSRGRARRAVAHRPRCHTLRHQISRPWHPSTMREKSRGMIRSQGSRLCLQKHDIALAVGR